MTQSNQQRMDNDVHGNNGVRSRMLALEESDIGRKINLYYHIIAGKIVLSFEETLFRKSA